MNKVSDINQFNSLVMAVKKQNRKYLTNCYLFQKEIQEYIEQKNIYWSSTTDGIIFFFEESDFYYLYFYLIKLSAGTAKILREKPDKTIIIDLVYVESNRSLSQKMIEEYWMSNGFRPYKLYKKYELIGPVGKDDFPAGIEFINASYRMGFAEQKHANEISALWRNSLDIFSLALPDSRELAILIKNRQIRCVFDIDGHVAGVLKQQKQGNVFSVWHVAVDKNHRHQGLARILMVFSMLENRDASRFIIWVEENNSPALNLYHHLGYNFLGKVSRQLILN